MGSFSARLCLRVVNANASRLSNPCDASALPSRVSRQVAPPASRKTAGTPRSRRDDQNSSAVAASSCAAKSEVAAEGADFPPPAEPLASTRPRSLVPPTQSHFPPLLVALAGVFHAVEYERSAVDLIFAPYNAEPRRRPFWSPLRSGPPGSPRRPLHRPARRRCRQACPPGVTGNGLAAAPPRDSPKSLTFPP